MRQVSCYGSRISGCGRLHLIEEQTLEIPVSASYDKEKLKEKISTLNVVTGEQTQPASSTPFFDGEKFVPGEEGKGTAVDVDTLNEVIPEMQFPI